MADLSKIRAPVLPGALFIPTFQSVSNEIADEPPTPSPWSTGRTGTIK